MLAQQIDNVVTQISELTSTFKTEQHHTNELLTAILAAIRDGGSLPPAPANAKIQMVADNDPTNKIENSDLSKTEKITLDDIREALIEVKENHNRDVAIEMVEKFSGGISKVSAIPKEKYIEVMAECAALNFKGAA